ncbi:hypothetical protein [Roseiarcus fermentans]|uniref:hypothetical protein n=1 Tax=Roseiarcus fermentans TaxID=1473586 RepID=UPI0011BE8ABC|nr:hypothetical protein [Roseiarcus fermentans]
MCGATAAAPEDNNAALQQMQELLFQKMSKKFAPDRRSRDACPPGEQRAFGGGKRADADG